MHKKIESLHNPLVKHLLNLRVDKDYRNHSQTLLVEGKKMVRELSQKEIIPLLIVSDPSLAEGIRAKDVVLATEQIIKKISGLESPEGILAELNMPPFADFRTARNLVVLDGISDPGNMGTLIRTALALEWEGIYILENSCDPFNDKALRASKGSIFSLPLKIGNWEDLKKIIEEQKLFPLAADLKGEPIQDLQPVKHPLLVLGNESKGVSEEAKDICRPIAIPINSEVDSLNVAVAGGILMFQLRQNG